LGNWEDFDQKSLCPPGAIDILSPAWDLCAMAAAVTARAGGQQADGSDRARVRAAQ